MRETIKRLLREEGQKKDPIKDILFKYWDKNGPSVETGKYFSLSDFETAKYLIEYHGDGLKDLITEKVKDLVENYHSCNGDEFNLRFDSVDYYEKKDPNLKDSTKYPYYNVSFSIDYNSAVFHNEFDFDDHENLTVLYGQIEHCVEEMLNDTLYDTYGVPAYYGLLNGVYDSNI